MQEQNQQNKTQNPLKIKPQKLQIVEIDGHHVVTDQPKNVKKIQKTILQHAILGDQSQPQNIDNELDHGSDRLKFWQIAKCGSIQGVSQHKKQVPLQSKQKMKKTLNRINGKSFLLDTNPIYGSNNTGSDSKEFRQVIIDPCVEQQLQISEHSSEYKVSSQQNSASIDLQSLQDYIQIRDNCFEKQAPQSMKVKISDNNSQNQLEEHKKESQKLKARFSNPLVHDKNLVFTKEQYQKNFVLNNLIDQRLSESNQCKQQKSQIDSNLYAQLDKNLQNEFKRKSEQDESEKNHQDDQQIIQNCSDCQLIDIQQLQGSQPIDNESIRPQNQEPKGQELLIEESFNQSDSDFELLFDFADEKANFDEFDVEQKMLSRCCILHNKKFTASRGLTVNRTHFYFLPDLE